MLNPPIQQETSLWRRQASWDYSQAVKHAEWDQISLSYAGPTNEQDNMINNLKEAQTKKEVIHFLY